MFFRKFKSMIFPGSKRKAVNTFANRRKIKLNGLFSDCEIVNNGVLQGNVKEPLKFICERYFIKHKHNGKSNSIHG